MPMQIIGQPTLLPDGRYRVLMYDAATGQTETRVVGEAQDPVAAATQAGQTAAAQTRAIYSDPWYVENVLGPTNRSAEAAAKRDAQLLQNQADQLKLQGRVAEANIKQQQAQIKLRKAELAQQGYLTERGQMLQAGTAMANLRGFGNAAQAIDLGRRLSSFGTQTGALADLAEGRAPQGGAFGFKPGQNPVTMADRMSGMLGASQDQINQRDANDRRLAQQIASRAGQLPRGSLESLAPEERDYLDSYLDATGDSQSFKNRYAAAGIFQGRRY